VRSALKVLSLFAGNVFAYVDTAVEVRAFQHRRCVPSCVMTGRQETGTNRDKNFTPAKLTSSDAGNCHIRDYVLLF
jgi:hypothetical protein